MFYLDKNQIAKAFHNAADNYDTAAILHPIVAQELLNRLEYIRIEPKRILDIGCGTGSLLPLLENRFKQADVLGLDIAFAMAQRAQEKLSNNTIICNDAESIAIKSHSIDIVVSNLSLQWCNLPMVFKEVKRVLAPGGLFMFSTFGPDTLTELRQAWALVDEGEHVMPFTDMHDMGDLLMKAKLQDPVVDSEHFALTYNDIFSLMKDLKTLGAANKLVNRNKGLTPKSSFPKLAKAYEKFKDRSGSLPATYEVIHGHCWQPNNQNQSTLRQSTANEEGEVRVGIETIGFTHA